MIFKLGLLVGTIVVIGMILVVVLLGDPREG